MLTPTPTEGTRQPAVGLNPRITFGFLLGLSVVTFGLGVWQIGKTIKSPFVGTQTVSTQDQLTSGDASLVNVLRTKDTDRDGLSDYDELYTYGTSPYLPDSDSDAFSDGDEVAKGEDPNCPGKQDCRGVNNGTKAPSVSGEEAEGVFPGSSLIDILGVQNTAEPSAPAIESEGGALAQVPGSNQVEVTPALLRQLLEQSGQIDPETLKTIDDETLLRVYTETMQQSQSAGTGSTAP